MSDRFRMGDLIQRNMTAGLWECQVTAVVIRVNPTDNFSKPYELYIVRHARHNRELTYTVRSGGHHYERVKLPGDDR